jgi:hypothetical protein
MHIVASAQHTPPSRNALLHCAAAPCTPILCWRVRVQHRAQEGWEWGEVCTRAQGQLQARGKVVGVICARLGRGVGLASIGRRRGSRLVPLCIGEHVLWRAKVGMCTPVRAGGEKQERAIVSVRERCGGGAAGEHRDADSDQGI